EKMRKVRPLARPTGHRVVGAAARALGIATGEPGDREDARAEVRRRVAVAALDRLLEEDRDAPAELAQLSEVKERPQLVKVVTVDLPDDPTALLTQNGERLVKQAVGATPAPLEKRRSGGRAEARGEAVRIADAARELLSDSENTRGAARRAGSARR